MINQAVLSNRRAVAKLTLLCTLQMINRAVLSNNRRAVSKLTLFCTLQMINQAVLSNRRAVAKLTLNLMEDDLQKEALHRLRWEDKLKDWKRIKVLAAVNRFK